MKFFIISFLKYQYSKKCIKKDKNLEYDLLNLFLEDYYTFFIYENIKDFKEKNEKGTLNDFIRLDETVNFLKYLLYLKEKRMKNKENDFLKNIANIMNWIQCYKEDIITILKIFSLLNLIVGNLSEKMKSINLNSYEGLNNYIELETNPHFSNNILLSGMESILRVLTSDKDIYIRFLYNQKYFENFINISEEIKQNSFKLEVKINLTTKELFSFQEIIEIIKALKKEQKVSKENIEAVIKFFSEESCLISEVKIKEHKQSDLFSHFEKFYRLLEILFK